MKRVVTACLISLLLPIIITIVLTIININLQPEPLSIASEEKLTTSYIKDNKVYELSGEIICLPKVNLNPQDFGLSTGGYAFEKGVMRELDSNPTLTKIHSLREIRCDECAEDGYYKALTYFTINLPSNAEYALWFPSEFCEYTIYVNGILAKESRTYGTASPTYPGAFYVDLPKNKDGIYEIIANFTSPTNYANTATDAILLGSYEKVERSFSNVAKFSLFFSTFGMFSIVFILIQLLPLRLDYRLLTFVGLSGCTLLVTAFRDGRLILMYFPRLPYNIGSFMEAISVPLYLLLLLCYTRAMYEDFFPKKVGKIFIILLVVPLANALCLGQFALLRYISDIITVIPYAICLYVFIRAFQARESHILAYGAGILTTEISVLLDITTMRHSIPARFSYAIGYLIIAITMVGILATQYAKQKKEEAFYTDELKRQLAQMQASENAFLNAQMKPHFLYNTLNTIADLCVTDAHKAQKLINSLSEYLKLILSLDNMDETVPLRREFELVEAYTDIERERFPSINFYVEKPIHMPTIMMPPLTIQPLIENAIKHGVRKLDKPGVITLRIVDNPDSVDFFVSDNGVGMDEETIHTLLTKVPKENQSVGIYNINKRLKRLYKKGLSVESTPGLGTCVSFKVYKYM